MPFLADLSKNLIVSYKDAPIFLEKYLKDSKILGFFVAKGQNGKWAAWEATDLHKRSGWSTHPIKNLKREAIKIAEYWEFITKLPFERY
jgi:hypothetical protein